MNWQRTLQTLLAVAIVFALASCEKARLNRETTTAEDYALAQRLYDDVYAVAEEASEQTEGSGKRTTITYHTSCASISISPVGDPTAWPKTITLDFGSTGCTSEDGKDRSGKVTTVVTGPYREAGTVLTTTLENYTVDGYAVEGTKTVTNQGANASGNLQYAINVSNGRITTPEDKVIEWTSTRTREWIEGEETTILSEGIAGLLDDVYEITGSVNGVNSEGRDFTVTVTEPIRVELDCRWVTSGKLEISPDELKTRTIDYGDGACDNEASVEIGNRDFDIRLR